MSLPHTLLSCLYLQFNKTQCIEKENLFCLKMKIITFLRVMPQMFNLSLPCICIIIACIYIPHFVMMYA